MNLADHIRDIADFPKPGIVFKDITPLLAHPVAFKHSIQLLRSHYEGRGVGAIAAAEARGFLVAAPLAIALDLPLIPLRKPGKLPYQTHCLQYELEYGVAELHIHVDAIASGVKVLVVDDLLATGGTLRAGCQLIEKAGGEVFGCAVLVELDFLHGRKKLEPFEVFSLVRF